MANNGTEFSGKTVEAAIEAGLQSLGLSQDDAVIDILNRGSRGILGFGSEPATVRISPRQAGAENTQETDATEDEAQTVVEESTVEDASVIAEDSEETASGHSAELVEEVVVEEVVVEDSVVENTVVKDTGVENEVIVTAEVDIDDSVTEGIDDDELAKMAMALLGELLSLMDFEADIDTSWQDGDATAANPYLLLDIRGENLGALIGRRGETLASIQYLLRLMVNQQVKQWKNIVVDVEHYKQRRIEQLAQLAERMARQVTESGRAVALEPMPGNERRIIHLTLRDNPDVFTESTGESDRRKVNIFPQH
jgi:spoIIIJ-associated protein